MKDIQLKNLLALRAKKTETLTKLKSLIQTADNEKRSMSKEESTQFETLKVESEDLNTQIQRSEFLVNEERSLVGEGENLSNKDEPTNEELRTFVQTGDNRSLSAGTNKDGGFTVVPSLDKTILKLLTDNSVFRQNATVMSISSQSYEQLVSVGGTSAAWASETDTRSETNTSELVKVTISLDTLYAFPKTTQELLDWSDFDVSGWLSSEVAQEMGDKENAAFWNGTGTGQPKGLLTYTTAGTVDGVRAFGTIQETETATADTITGDDLITFQHTLATPYRTSAKFYCNDAMLLKIRKLKDTDGNYLWRAGIQEGASSTLLGKPIEIDNQITDDLIVYGDLARAYKIIDHTSGTRMIRDNVTTIGYVKMATSRYVGGGLIDSNAIKLLSIKE